jgi:hypothetical protein
MTNTGSRQRTLIIDPIRKSHINLTCNLQVPAPNLTIPAFPPQRIKSEFKYGTTSNQNLMSQEIPQASIKTRGELLLFFKSQTTRAIFYYPHQSRPANQNKILQEPPQTEIKRGQVLSNKMVWPLILGSLIQQ